jgi:outer membrane protein
MKRTIFTSLLAGIALHLLCNGLFAQGQKPVLNLSLKNVVDLAIAQSTSIKVVQNRNVKSFWRYKNFQTSFRPQLILSGDLPNYSHTTQPVTQPDGSIEFKQVSNAQMFANLSLSQSIPFSGTSIYAASSVYRIQDFNNANVEFSGTPVTIGFVQPVFSYNWMKWSKRTEPLLYEESEKDFIESVEDIALNATRRFFNYLRIQTDYNLAQSNLKNSNDNLKIAGENSGPFRKTIFQGSGFRLSMRQNP